MTKMQWIMAGIVRFHKEIESWFVTEEEQLKEIQKEGMKKIDMTKYMTKGGKRYGTKLLSKRK